MYIQIGEGTYKVDGDEIIALSCGRHACDDGVVAGHCVCMQPSAEALLAERQGYIVCSYDGSGWRWFMTEKGHRRIAGIAEAWRSEA